MFLIKLRAIIIPTFWILHWHWIISSKVHSYNTPRFWARGQITKNGLKKNFDNRFWAPNKGNIFIDYPDDRRPFCAAIRLNWKYLSVVTAKNGNGRWIFHEGLLFKLNDSNINKYYLLWIMKTKFTFEELEDDSCQETINLNTIPTQFIELPNRPNQNQTNQNRPYQNQPYQFRPDLALTVTSDSLHKSVSLVTFVVIYFSKFLF